jgi:F0F1-type ATP synthase membrane subunit c/vacuolar-type H+-ATPase subunit K
MQTKIQKVEALEGRYPNSATYSGYSILAAGLTTGFANMACGYVDATLTCLQYPLLSLV